MLETTSTQASGASYPPGSVGGSCADGFGNTQSMTQAPIYAYPGSTQQVETSGSASLGGTRYSSQPGSSPSLTCSPSATASASSTASSDLTYTASVTAVAITPTGAVKDSSGNWNILVGQHCTPTLGGVPSGTGWSVTYQWSVSGTTFQTWSATTPAVGNAPANPNASYYVAGPGPLGVATPGWYWNDPSQTMETISCTAMVTPPSGQGAPFSVTATQQVTVMVPSFTARGIGGYVQVNPYAPNDNNYEMWAGPTAQEKTNGQSGGMHWQLSVTTPIVPAFGTGKLELVQITTPNDSYTNDTTPSQSRSDPLNGVTGLDGQYPYALASESSGTPLTDDDEPGLVLVGTTYQAASASFNATFTDYLMHEPPNSSQSVPLAMFTWSTNGSAQVPITDSWGDYSRFQGGGRGGDGQSHW